MTTILVTTDFSANSRAGVRFAMQLASQMPCKLVFYNALEVIAPTSWSKQEAADFIANETEGCRKEMARFIKNTLKKTYQDNVAYDYVVEINTDIDNAIVAYAQKINADYICMSTRGAGTMKKWIGTNASTLVSTSPIPVIVVPKSYRFKPITKVGYSSDFENFGKEIKTVGKLASALNSTIDVYHFSYQLHESESQTELEEIEEKYASDNIAFFVPKLKIEYSLVDNLRHVVKRQKPSILVMFTKHTHNWFERFFYSSKTADMTFDIKVPLLAFRK
jgi:nucleotide-binding universal stress UspA family protein